MVCKAMPSTVVDEPVLFLWYKGDSAYAIHGIDRRDNSGGKNLVSSRGTDPRFSIQDNDLMTALTIHKIRKEDEGQYRCRVDYKLGPTTNRFMKLNVEGMDLKEILKYIFNLIILVKTFLLLKKRLVFTTTIYYLL